MYVFVYGFKHIEDAKWFLNMYSEYHPYTVEYNVAQTYIYHTLAAI